MGSQSSAPLPKPGDEPVEALVGSITPPEPEEAESEAEELDEESDDTEAPAEEETQGND